MSPRPLPVTSLSFPFFLGLVTLLGACAPSTRAPRSLPHDHSLTATDLSSLGSASLYDAIVRLRPTLLHSRTPATIPRRSPAGLLVIVDGISLGPPTVLRHLPARDVAVVRYLSAWDAAARYGSGASNGVIEVTTKR